MIVENKDKEPIWPSITKYPGGWYGIDVGSVNPDTGERRVTLFTMQGSFDLFQKALKEQLEKVKTE